MKPYGDELDVIRETQDELTIIECKIDPRNVEIDEAILKLQRRLSKYETTKKKGGVFCFWDRPSQPVIEKLMTGGIEFYSLSEIIDHHPDWRDKKQIN